jgi:hypothetical protein
MQVTLNKLIPGNEYAVQVFVQLPGYGYANWVYTFLDGAVALQWSSANKDDGSAVGKYSIGTFTADASTQTFSVEAWDGSEGHYIGWAPINALQLRGETGGEVPEPGTMLLLGGSLFGLLVGGFRRVRNRLEV